MDPKEYLSSINDLHLDDLSTEMYNYAHENEVPIIQDEGLALLRQIVAIKQPTRILEIGTAIGFSAIQMAKACNAEIVSIEIDPLKYEIALQNVKKSGYNIQLILGDALEVDLDGSFDFIFIDAAKAQYQKFFERFSGLLKKGGVVFTDNLTFHGLVTEEIKNRNLRGLVRKIKNYNSWLMTNTEYDSYIYGIGDGIAISVKK